MRPFPFSHSVTLRYLDVYLFIRSNTTRTFPIPNQPEAPKCSRCLVPSHSTIAPTDYHVLSEVWTSMSQDWKEEDRSPDIPSNICKKPLVKSHFLIKPHNSSASCHKSPLFSRNMTFRLGTSTNMIWEAHPVRFA